MLSVPLRLRAAAAATWLMAGCSGHSADRQNPLSPVASQPAASVATYISAVVDTTPLVTTSTRSPLTPAVLVLDQYYRPLRNVLVTFSIADTGSGSPAVSGSVIDARALTDSSGVATCGGWQVGGKEGLAVVTATVPGAFVGAPVVFRAVVLLPDPAGTRYDLVTRDGTPLDRGTLGWIVLGADNHFRLVWIWGSGTTVPYVETDGGSYTRSDTTLSFATDAGYVWARGYLTAPGLTFTYDDSADVGFPYTAIEVYRKRE